MSKKHSHLYDDVLGGLDDVPAERPSQRGSRFLKRSTTIADQLSGEVEEKTLRWVDPAECKMWARHNRDYGLLTEENCRDLIDGIRAQGRQEFAAIVRPIDDPNYSYEVICGARRHFAVSWLRANTYTQFKYLIDVREMSDEEAFRLADIENRDREDISDFERAIDYADAIERYYGGKQKAMAERLEVSPPWLSRYLQLAKLPADIVNAFATIRDIKERHARDLKPIISDPEANTRVLEAARVLGAEQARARSGKGRLLDGPEVMKRLKAAARPPAPPKQEDGTEYSRSTHDTPILVRHRGRKTVIEFDSTLSNDALSAALGQFLEER
ncbi:ParB/RepB/Spo0J family partition protein [Shimia ponticola]|uniref:ParB/RepB/Spo0J family partition protein n=1 Tax=Shimia ponticola TaxID=2582893 RepID=UPI0011BE68EA|nr:ParB/RepB/Spo0J family partition protein [Shimia ponticola]